ncbi:MAG: lysoplasmalogenase [Gemmatimonadota bacterium]|nr:lysoplasmalogenase [Gemmatimonadota bacterium]
MIPGLLVMVGVSAVLAMIGEERGPRWLVYVWKPATTVMILAIAVFGDPGTGRYQLLIAVGLVASLAGDVFLMLPSDRFVAGLVSFLAAHLAYLTAFATPPGGRSAWLVLGVLVLVGGAVLCVLWPGLGQLRGPVSGYVAVILAMAWMATTRWLQMPSGVTAAAAGGALLFVASDTLLALDRFRRRFAFARAWVLATYYTAQTLIALSVPGLRGG